MAGMADEYDFEAFLMVDASLGMDLGDQGARRIQIKEVPPLGRRWYRFRHPMCRKDHGGIRIRYLVQLLHKNGAFCLERVDNVTVVDDFVAHIDGRPELGERQFDDLDGAIDSGAEAARGGQ